METTMIAVGAMAPVPAYVLRFQPLRSSSRGLAFPCDATGQVDLDGLSEDARNSYFFARCTVGRDFATPIVDRLGRARRRVRRIGFAGVR